MRVHRTLGDVTDTRVTEHVRHVVLLPVRPAPRAAAADAATAAARRDGYVPICRGLGFPVAVSTPSTRTTHLPGC